MSHIVIPYSPRSAFKAYHERVERWAVIVAHRRAGKTVSCLNDLIKRAFVEPGALGKENCRYAYIAPFLKQAKDVAWDYLKRYSQPIPGIKVNESELRIDYPNGSRIRLYGADNGEAIRGVYFDGVVVDEPADMDGNFWSEVLAPTLIDRKGWCTWIGTPKGRNAFFHLYEKARMDPTYYAMILPASRSGILPKEDLEAEKNRNPVSYAQEYECDFSAAVKGAIYGKEVAVARANNRIRDYGHDATVPLFTAWDIGQSDFTSIWLMQFVGRDICILDHYSNNGQPPAHYAKKVNDWSEKYSVPVAANFLPHDANTHGPSGVTYVTYLQEAGLTGTIKVVPRTPDVWLGINELKSLFHRIYIHQTNCSRTWKLNDTVYPSGLDCLEYYHTREVSDNGTISEQPVHDMYSHSADALRTFAEAYRLGMVDGTSLSVGNRMANPPTVIKGVSNGIRPVTIRGGLTRYGSRAIR